MSGKKKHEENGNRDLKLRDNAEDQLARHADVSLKLKDKTPEKLIHELQVHQIELEMQNEELKTSRVEVEVGLALYAELYDFAPVGYFTLDRDGAIHLVNLTAARLLGLERGRLIGRRFRLFVSTADRPAFNVFLEKVFADRAKETCDVALCRKEKSPPSPERSSKRPFGETGQLIVHIEAIAYEDGQKCRAVMVDITERKQAEENLKKKDEELHDTTQQLWQAEKLATMGELAASIAHELNNPLATVSLRVESLLARTQADSPDRREVKIIEKEIERMGNLVSNLLQFSRRGQQQISTLDVCKEIEKTLELIYYHLRKYKIAVIKEFAPDVPRIHADRQQLRELFLNLFTNAGDAMPRGGTLTIRVTAPPESGQIIIEVADTGTGIPPEILPKVTEPFYTTKVEGKGTGLGLSICRRIVEEHNGTFDLTSEGIPGRGTTARISLPITNETNAADLKNQ